jgi:hypothetical protein
MAAPCHNIVRLIERVSTRMSSAKSSSITNMFVAYIWYLQEKIGDSHNCIIDTYLHKVNHMLYQACESSIYCEQDFYDMYNSMNDYCTCSSKGFFSPKCKISKNPLQFEHKFENTYDQIRKQTRSIGRMQGNVHVDVSNILVQNSSGTNFNIVVPSTRGNVYLNVQNVAVVNSSDTTFTFTGQQHRSVSNSSTGSTFSRIARTVGQGLITEGVPIAAGFIPVIGPFAQQATTRAIDRYYGNT